MHERCIILDSFLLHLLVYINSGFLEIRTAAQYNGSESGIMFQAKERSIHA